MSSLRLFKTRLMTLGQHGGTKPLAVYNHLRKNAAVLNFDKTSQNMTNLLFNSSSRLFGNSLLNFRPAHTHHGILTSHKPATSVLTSLFHTSSAPCRPDSDTESIHHTQIVRPGLKPNEELVPLKIPTAFQPFLQSIDQRSANPISTIDELDARAQAFYDEFVDFYKNSCELCPTTERLRPTWYRKEAQNWCEFQEFKQDAYWGEFIVKDPKDKHVIMVKEVMEKLNSAPFNKAKLQRNKWSVNSRAYNCDVKIVDVQMGLGESGRRTGTCSYPVGTIYISKEFLDKLSPNKTAFVLARELAHIYLDHMAERFAIRSACLMFAHHTRVSLKKAVDAGATPAGAPIPPGANLAEAWKPPKPKPEKPSRRKSAPSRMQMGHTREGEGFAPADAEVERITMALLDNISKCECFPRPTQMELEADALGIMISTSAGFDPNSVIKLLERDYALKSLARDEFLELHQPVWDEFMDDIYKTHYIRKRHVKEHETKMLNYLNEKSQWEPKMPSPIERQGVLTDPARDIFKDALEVYEHSKEGARP